MTRDAVRHFWFSSKRITIYVGCDARGRVVDTAPVARRFIGQPINHLANWMRSQDVFEWHELERRPRDP